MTAVALVLILLLVAFVGGQWSSVERKGAFGTVSGVEYVMMGLLLGPKVLGSLDAEVLHAFEPISLVALGWIALGYGVDCGCDERRLTLARFTLSALFNLVVVGGAAAAVYAVTPDMDWVERVQWSLGLGLVATSSARDAVQVMVARLDSSGPVSEWLQRVSVASDAPVLIALPFLFAVFYPGFHVRGVPAPFWSMAAVGLTLGGLLGAIVAWLASLSHSSVERWTLLLGATWLATGLSESLGLGGMGVSFCLGLVLALRVGEPARLKTRIDATEGPVVLPALVLAGAHLSPPVSELEWLVLGLAVAARLLLGAGLYALMARRAHPAASIQRLLGVGMLSPSTLNVLVGFSVLLHFGANVGRVSLSAACLGAFVGEIIGPWALRRALLEAGERGTAPPAPPAQAVIAAGVVE